MEVSVLQENLDRVLTMTKPFTPAKSYLPACQTVRLTAGGGSLTVEATDLEKSIKATIGAQVVSEGSICVNANSFKSFVSTLPSDRIDLRSKNGDELLALVIEAGDSDATMAGIDSEELPSPAEIGESVKVVFTAGELRKAFVRVSTALSKEETRPVLTGIHLVVDQDGYVFESADGFRLVRQTGPLVEGPEERYEAVVPGHTVLAMRGILRDLDTTEPVVLELEQPKKTLRFTMPGCSVTTMDVQGQYPNVEQLLPKSHDWSFEADGESIKAAVRSAAVYASAGVNIVRFSTAVEGDDPDVYTLWVSATAEDIGDAKREVSGAATAGLVGADESLVGKIAFNAAFIKDMLTVVEGPVVMEATTPSSPAVWRIADDDTFRFVIMPMFVSW